MPPRRWGRAASTSSARCSSRCVGSQPHADPHQGVQPRCWNNNARNGPGNGCGRSTGALPWLLANSVVLRPAPPCGNPLLPLLPTRPCTPASADLPAAQAVFCLLVHTLPMAALLLPLPALLRWLGQPEDVTRLVGPYLLALLPNLWIKAMYRCAGEIRWWQYASAIGGTGRTLAGTCRPSCLHARPRPAPLGRPS